MPYNDEVDFLCEIYDLNDMHMDVIRETMRINHAYDTIGDPQILTEGLSDIINKMGDFFKKMAEKVKEFFRKILMIINSLFMDIDKFVKKYRKELDSVKDVDFTIKGYKFTINDKPNLEPFQDLVNSYNDSLSDIGKLKSADIRKESNEKMSDSHLDKVRAKVLGVSTPITEEDFHKTIRETYRNGEEYTVDITVDTSMYRQTVDGVEALVKDKKSAEKLRDELIVLLDKTQKFFDKKVPTVYKDGNKQIATKRIDTSDNKFSTKEEEYSNYSDSTYNTFNEYIRYKYNYCRKIAGIVNLVATEYANAYKDQVKMSKEIIMTGLKSKPKKDESNVNEAFSLFKSKDKKKDDEYTKSKFSFAPGVDCDDPDDIMSNDKLVSKFNSTYNSKLSKDIDKEVEKLMKHWGSEEEYGIKTVRDMKKYMHIDFVSCYYYDKDKTYTVKVWFNSQGKNQSEEFFGNHTLIAHMTIDENGNDYDSYIEFAG